ncbi:MAG: hypothetical protein AAGI72_02315 [Pseudomonadota bacterium]
MSEAVQRAASAVFYVVALFYGYGALVHVLNIAGLNGFDWLQAPLKWQILDITYLLLDLIVCIGFVLRRRLSVAAFMAAAISQVFLYTVFRDWIIDVPAAFAVTPEQESYLTKLVVFHVASLLFVALSYRAAGRTFFGGRGSEAP